MGYSDHLVQQFWKNWRSILLFCFCSSIQDGWKVIFRFPCSLVFVFLFLLQEFLSVFRYFQTRSLTQIFVPFLFVLFCFCCWKIKSFLGTNYFRCPCLCPYPWLTLGQPLRPLPTVRSTASTARRLTTLARFMTMYEDVISLLIHSFVNWNDTPKFFYFIFFFINFFLFFLFFPFIVFITKKKILSSSYIGLLCVPYALYFIYLIFFVSF
jgi:hypothetical protein